MISQEKFLNHKFIQLQKLLVILQLFLVHSNTNGIFVDDAEVFFYEKGEHLSSSNPDETDGDYNLEYNTVDALVTSGEINVGASATAIVSASGTVSSFDITNAGSGYA